MSIDIERLFFSVLRAGLWEKDVESQKYDSAVFAEIMRLAEEQSVVGLITAGLEYVKGTKIPQEWVLQFVGSTLQIEQRNKSMNEFVALLIERLRKADIYALLVKGQCIAQCYERPLWRASGDIDLLLSIDNYNKAKKILLPLASHSELENITSKHLGMTIDGWEVELHGTLYSGLSSRIKKTLKVIVYDTFYKGNVRSWLNGHTQVFLLSAENEIFYCFTHFLGHFYGGGVGLRQICDWCRLLYTYKQTLNSELLRSRINEAGLMTQWKAFGSFAVEYLGMPHAAMPFYSSDAKWLKKAGLIKSFIMEVGNMGHNRDFSYYGKYPFLVRKVISFWIRTKDIARHARIFPIDTLRIFPSMVIYGLRSAIKG